MTPETFTVWEWSGRTWRRTLADVDGADTRAALASLEPGTSRASFSTVLDFDPNHAGADDLAEMADAIAGPIPDTTPRRRHTR